MAARAPGVYRPRRPRASPLYRLVQDHFETLAAVHEECFEPTLGPLRPVVREVVEKFLDCGLLESGFARVRCGSCRAEFLVAFSCKCRYFCPSCHAKRLALWTQWLETDLLAPVPHRQYVFTLPKRLRPYFLYDRRLLGLLSRVAYRTLRGFLRATLAEPDLVPGVIASIQTFGSLANFHPHLHLLVTDGAYRPDGTFLPLGFHDVGVLTEAFRRALLRAFVHKELLSDEVAASMLAWPHSGFHVHHGVRLEPNDLPGTLHLARYAARAPVALDRLRYDAGSNLVSLTSDKTHGPTAGTHTFDPLDFLARLVTHIPQKGEVMVRYYGAYSSRRRGRWRRAGVLPRPEHPDASSRGDPPDQVAPSWPELRARRRRWADLLRKIFEVDPLRCPRCGAEMRIVAFLLDPPAIDAILIHLRRAGRDARAGPWARAGPTSAAVAAR